MMDSSTLLKTAKAIAGLARKLGLGDRPSTSHEAIDILDLYYEIVTDAELIRHTEKRFINGHYQDAVFEAFKYLNNYIKSRVKTANADGANLMRSAFSAAKPILRLNDLSSQSHRDEQMGYMDIFAGAMTGVRNPRAHENDFDNDPFTAIQLLSLASHLLERAKKATRVTRRKK